MARFIHSVLAQNESVTVGTVISYDLPVNPLSHVLLTLKFAQDQANTQLTFANIAAVISKVEVLYKGSGVFSMSGLDALACGIFINGFESWGVNALGADNELRSFTFLLPFTRSLYSPRECYPASTRGELILQITYASSFTQIDGVSAQIETVELPDAAPERYLKMTTLSVTPSSTGELDIDLPIGNDISDIIFWGTTIPAGATATRTLTYVQLLMDNERKFYSQVNFETAMGMAGRMRAAPGYWGSHTHDLIESTYSQYDDTSPNDAANHILANHLHLPFDVTKDSMYILQTAGLSSLVARISAGDTNPLRVIPVEIVQASRRV
jgi:hypothetical protein